MISITEPKIAGLDPRWARFAGFSLLFDPPRPSFLAGDGIEILEADGYGRFGRALDALQADRLLEEYGFCRLPPASYHVTAYDVANVADLSRGHPAVCNELSALLNRLPEASAFDDPLLRGAAESELAATDWNLEFGFDAMTRWGSLRLAPRDPEAFARFVAARAALSREYGIRYGIGAGERYTPHLTLGYFLNGTGADLARPRIPEWDRALREAIGDETLILRTVSLYGFTDMATFFRRSGP